MNLPKLNNFTYSIFVIVCILIVLYILYFYVLYPKNEHFDTLNQTTVSDDNNIIDYSNFQNILTNGDFANGKDIGGYIDQSGFNEIIQLTNPSSSKYVLHQKDTRDLTYYEIIQPVTVNSTYVMLMWVKLENPISKDTVDFSRLLRLRILKQDGSNEIPPIRVSIVKRMTIEKDGTNPWYLVKYSFSTSNNVRDKMNIYLNYGSELIASDIYYTGISLYKVLSDIESFVFTNGLVALISGFYCDSGVLSWRDLGNYGNNFTLKNRAVVDKKEGFVNLYNNVVTQTNGKGLFSSAPIFMINSLLSVLGSQVQEEEMDDDYPIFSILDANNSVMIALKVTNSNKIILQCKEKSITSSSLILMHKTLLSMSFNNDTHKLIFYQDNVPLLVLDDCPTLYFETSKFIINANQYLKLNVYDLMIHNYILLENEHKLLRSYLMESSNRYPKNVPSIFDYILPTNWNSSNGTVTLEYDETKDPFYLSFQKNSNNVYSNAQNGNCNVVEVKPSDCPTAYKKGNDYYIFIPKDSYYSNKLGYYGEKYYGTEKDKVKYIYQNNFPDCELPVILTDRESGQYSNTCPFIIETNNPCKSVGCGNVNWDVEYVEDLNLKDSCKNAVTYYCRTNYDLDPKCSAWKPSNKDDKNSIRVRNYFENSDKYCDIKNYRIEDHPDFNKYVRKDNIPCWGCDLSNA